MELEPDQVEVYNLLVERYATHKVQLLPAVQGFGKSFLGISLAKHFKEYKPAVICPKTLIPMWEKMFNEVGIKPLFIHSYSTMAGSNNPYLKKTDKKDYVATKLWRKPVFLICDESQAIKNKTSSRHWAAFALISTIQGKVLHLTAGPIDKEANWTCLYRNMGIMTKPDVMVYRNKEWKLTGLKQVFNACPPQLVDKVYKNYDIKRSTINDILSYLWIKHFRQTMTIPVKDPVYTHMGQPVTQTLCNLFVTLSKEDQALADKGIEHLKGKGIIKDNKIDMKNLQSNFGAIQLALMDLCKSKVNSVVHLAIERLKQPGKVVIACPFIMDQNELCLQLKDYNPLLLNGKTKDREDVVRKFNHGNKYRCLVMSLEVGGEGISLHDTNGRYPRTMYIIPNFYFLKIFQTSGRTYRRGSKSDSEVYIVYSSSDTIESILVHTLAKTEVANAVISPGSNRKYPGDYDIIGLTKPEIEKLKESLQQ